MWSNNKLRTGVYQVAITRDKTSFSCQNGKVHFQILSSLYAQYKDLVADLQELHAQAREAGVSIVVTEPFGSRSNEPVNLQGY